MPPTRNQKKPDWVAQEIIRLKALMAHTGCRSIAQVFNRLHFETRAMTVSKSYVAHIIAKNKHAIYIKRKAIKSKTARSYPANRIWSIDLTTLTDEHKHRHTILGIIDNGTRANLRLQRITSKQSSNLITHILETVQQFGKPVAIRTDNESVFTSYVFRLHLKILRIKHQLTDIACPWMNGRIERLFGTLKRAISQIAITATEIETRLMEFNVYYNHLRPHQNLKGKTPAEVWNQRLPDYTKPPQEVILWKGILVGYYWQS